MEKKFVFRDRFGSAQPIDRTMDRYQVEADEQWRALGDIIPYVSFPAYMRVRIIPPFAGAAARFVVRHRDSSKKKDWISVYLDAQDALGCVGAPYWEAYPIKGDTARFSLNEADLLIKALTKELKRLLKEQK